MLSRTEPCKSGEPLPHLGLKEKMGFRDQSRHLTRERLSSVRFPWGREEHAAHSTQHPPAPLVVGLEGSHEGVWERRWTVHRVCGFRGDAAKPGCHIWNSCVAVSGSHTFE